MIATDPVANQHDEHCDHQHAFGRSEQGAARPIHEPEPDRAGAAPNDAPDGRHHSDRHEYQECAGHPGLERLANPATADLADPLGDRAHEGPDHHIGGP